MKNTRTYRLPALLLAAIMIIGIMPVTAFGGSSIGPISMNYFIEIKDATFSYASDGKTVGTLDDLDPNKVSTMTVTVPGSSDNSLPKDSDGEMRVSLPDYVMITKDDAKACQSSDVTCTYRESSNQLVFKWKGNGKPEAGFTATVKISTNMPAARTDVSGTWVVVVKNGKGVTVAVQPELKKIDGADRLTAVESTILYNSAYRAGTDLPEWKITRVTGDWYTISISGKYLNYGKNGNNISLTDTPQYFRYGKITAGEQFIGYDDKGTGYYLNNKADNASKGIQASTYDNQSVLLYKELKPSDGSAMVMYSVNGGSADAKLTPVLVEKGATITLPEYKGTKNNYNFIGWATTGNIKQNVYYKIYQPGETFVVDQDTVDIYAVWSSKKPEQAQFGIRMSGDIPDEPAQYDVGAYSKQHIYKDGAVITGTWIVDTNAAGKAIEGNHVVNSVTANLTVLPTDDEIKVMYPGYDPETMYVHWYVLKYAGRWKVDGVIVSRSQQAEVRYDANVATENKGKIKNIPATYKVEEGTKIKIGTGVDGKKIQAPTYPDYTFDGWNTEPDGSGQSYDSNTEFVVDSNVTFYAQWTKIPTYRVAYELTNGTLETDGSTPEYYAGDIVTLPQMENRRNYIFSGWKVNGEEVKDSSFIMPDEDVEITGKYYGPIYVDIYSDWTGGSIAYKGAMITLTAELTGAEGLDCDLQWQYLKDDQWVNEDNATGITHIYELNEETSGRIWRVIVTDARPHQE